MYISMTIKIFSPYLQLNHISAFFCVQKRTQFVPDAVLDLFTFILKHTTLYRLLFPSRVKYLLHKFFPTFIASWDGEFDQIKNPIPFHFKTKSQSVKKCFLRLICLYLVIKQVALVPDSQTGMSRKYRTASFPLHLHIHNARFETLFFSVRFLNRSGTELFSQTGFLQRNRKFY